MGRRSANDESLLLQIAQGDEEAFTTVYRRYQGPIYRFALQMSGRQETAEEVTQEVFLSLIEPAAPYDPGRGSLSSYLYGIARNQVRRSFHRDQRYVPIEQPSINGNAPPERVEPSDAYAGLAKAERLEALRRAILTLPARYREVVVLCELQETSYQQAADILGCAVGTIRSRLYRARALLIEKVTAKAERPSPVVPQLEKESR